MYQARRSSKDKLTAHVTPEAEIPAVPAPARLTTKEVIAVEMEIKVEDNINTGIYKASLDVRGQEKQPDQFPSSTTGSVL